ERGNEDGGDPASQTVPAFGRVVRFAYRVWRSRLSRRSKIPASSTDLFRLAYYLDVAAGEPLPLHSPWTTTQFITNLFTARQSQRHGLFRFARSRAGI